MGRLGLSDTTASAALKMCEGNPGAASVIGQLLNTKDGFIALCHLDDAEIYGAALWVCYKDLCGEDITLLSEKIFEHKLKGEWQKVRQKYYDQGAVSPT